jgi:hypothetical protein
VSVAAITTVPGAACTLVVPRVDLAVGRFVGPNQAVLGRIGPITTRPRRYRILPICRHFRARRRHERHASHARGRWFETSRAHQRKASLAGISLGSTDARPASRGPRMLSRPAFRPREIRVVAPGGTRADLSSVASSDTREVAGSNPSAPTVVRQGVVRCERERLYRRRARSEAESGSEPGSSSRRTGRARGGATGHADRRLAPGAAANDRVGRVPEAEHSGSPLRGVQKLGARRRNLGVAQAVRDVPCTRQELLSLTGART